MADRGAGSHQGRVNLHEWRPFHEPRDESRGFQWNRLIHQCIISGLRASPIRPRTACLISPSREISLSDRNKAAEKAANFLSRAFNPIYVAVPAILAASLEVSDTVAQAFLWWGICIMLSTVLPFVDLVIRLKLGKVSDFHVTKKEERTVPMLFNIGYLTVGAVILWLLGAPKEIVAIEVSSLFMIAVALVVTFRWKISLHAIGLVEIYVLLLLVFRSWSFVLWTLFIPALIVAVCWARVYLRKHTVPQVLVGSAAGAAIPVLTFLAFGLL